MKKSLPNPKPQFLNVRELVYTLADEQHNFYNVLNLSRETYHIAPFFLKQFYTGNYYFVYTKPKMIPCIMSVFYLHVKKTSGKTGILGFINALRIV